MIADLEADRKERKLMNTKSKHSHRFFYDQMRRYDEKISALGQFESLSSLTKSLYDECLSLLLRESNYKDYKFFLNYDEETYQVLKK